MRYLRNRSLPSRVASTDLDVTLPHVTVSLSECHSLMLVVEGPGDHLFPALAFEDFVISATALCMLLQSAPPPPAILERGNPALTSSALMRALAGLAAPSLWMKQFLLSQSQGLLGLLDMAPLWPPTPLPPTESWGFPFLPGLLSQFPTPRPFGWGFRRSAHGWQRPFLEPYTFPPPSQVLVPEDQRESSGGFLLVRKTEV